MMRSGIYEAKIRCLRTITSKISNTFPQEISYTKMLLWIRVNQGLSAKMAREYLNDVIDSQGWHVDGEIIKATV